MTKAKSTNDRVVNTRYFHDLFLARKRKYPLSYFHYYIKTRKRSIPLPDGLWKKIIGKYLDIYFNEFYFEDRPKYFPLSGKLVKAKSSQYFVNTNRQRTSTGRAIGWVWFQRPNIAYWGNVLIKKLNGSTNRVFALDKRYKADRDVELLPSIKKIMESKDLVNYSL